MIGSICLGTFKQSLMLLKVGVKKIRATPTTQDSAADILWTFLPNFPLSVLTISFWDPRRPSAMVSSLFAREPKASEWKTLNSLIILRNKQNKIDK